MRKIDLSAELKQDAIRSIKEYFQQIRDEELSDYQATDILEFMLANVGPYIYNQALADVHVLMSDRIEDIFGLEKYPGKS